MATFQLFSATSLNLGQSQNDVLGKGLKELKESMDRCTDRHDITETLENGA